MSRFSMTAVAILLLLAIKSLEVFPVFRVHGYGSAYKLVCFSI